MSTNSATTCSRKVYPDVLRLLAIFLVIGNHTPFFLCDKVYTIDGEGGCVFFLLHLIKMAVPLFLMISGAFLLGKTESLTDVLRKRVFRIVAAILFFCLLQGIALSFVEKAFNMHFAVHECFNLDGHALVQWFLFLYFSLMLLLPLLRVLAQHMSNAHFLYMFALQIFFCGFYPAGMQIALGHEWVSANNFLSSGCSPVFAFSIMYGAFFMLSGYFAEVRLPHMPLKRGHFIVLTAISAALLLLSSLLTIRFGCLNNAPHIGGFLLLPCITLYWGIKVLFDKLTPAAWVQKTLTTAASGVFALMMIENIISERLLGADTENTAPLYSLVLALGIFVIGLPIGCLLKKLPLLSRIL